MPRTESGNWEMLNRLSKKRKQHHSRDNTLDSHLPPQPPFRILAQRRIGLVKGYSPNSKAQYAYPLTVFANWVAPVLRQVPVNTIYHQRDLAGLESTGIVNPNVDTIYSRFVLDLSRNDVILTIPQINNRYWVYPVYDPYGNVVAEIGSANNNAPGKYFIRRAEDAFAAPGFENSTATLKSLGYEGIVNVPGSYGTMLIRLLVVQNTTQELDTIHRIQNASRTENITRSLAVLQRNSAPTLLSLASNGSFLGISSLAQQLAFAARILPYSQTAVYSDRFRVASIFSQTGVYNGKYNAPASDFNFTQAGAIANASITAAIRQPQALKQLGNDWQLQTYDYQGYYGKHYAAAASVAIGGYQQQTQIQALYPQFQGRGFSSYITLEANKSLLFTRSAKPQLKQTGFWSLSAYGRNGYMIPNPLGRYEVGDRTYNITYQNGGGRVYGPQAQNNTDGPFHILLQRNTTTPPANWTNNWLPVTDEFLILLRFYVPEPSMSNGSYVCPKVENITAIQ